MPETVALTTRIQWSTARRLKVQSAQTGRSIQEIVDQALREFLAKWELQPDGTVEALNA